MQVSLAVVETVLGLVGHRGVPLGLVLVLVGRREALVVVLLVSSVVLLVVCVVLLVLVVVDFSHVLCSWVLGVGLTCKTLASMVTTSIVGLRPWYLVQHNSKWCAMDAANLATSAETVLVRMGAGAAVMVVVDPHVVGDSNVVSN